MELDKQKIEEALESVRPFLKEDGGDVELIKINQETKIVQVKLLGNCHDCPLSQMTLRAGIERILIGKVPSIRRVEAVK